MGLKVERKEIDGYEVKVKQISFTRTMKLGPQLLKVVSPILESGLQGDVNFSALASELVCVDVPHLMVELLSTTSIQIDDKWITLDDSKKLDKAFNGQLQLGLAVIGYTLSVNFGDFLGSGFGLGAEPLSKAE